MTVVYPQSDDWDEWDETLHVDEFVKERVQRATQAAQRGHRELARGTQRLKRKQSDATDRHTDGAGCSWTQHEDAQLRKLVQEEGVGNWETKASRFVSARTPNALRQRWCSHLSHLQPSDDTDAGTEREQREDRERTESATGWSSREDRQLRRMVSQQGTGNWERKAEQFETERSAAALRFRWYKLAKESGEREGEGEREMVSASQWTEREDRQLQSMVRTGGPGNWRQKAEATQVEEVLRVTIDVRLEGADDDDLAASVTGFIAKL